MEQLDFLIKEDQLAENEIKISEEVFKSNLRQKFGPEFKFLETTTLKFAVIFEINKTKSFMKEIDRLIFLQAKVTVISKTYM